MAKAKIGIVTVYNSENVGSFLQAFGLKTYIESKGFEVYFLKRNVKNTSHSISVVVRNFAAHTLRRGILAGMDDIVNYLCFSKAQRIFRTIDPHSKRLEDFSLFILGSDEIWNVKQKTFKNMPIFWGIGLDPQKTISYAPSVNMSSFDDFIDYEHISQLNKIKSTSVRDEHTWDVLSRFTDRPIQIVCDPAFFLNKEQYLKVADYDKLPYPYILVYGYDEIVDKDLSRRIREFAEKRKLRLVSFGFGKSWCDRNIAASPYRFLSLYNNAEMVITKTFHGTVMSVIFQKNFAVFASNNIKVVELLSSLGLESQNASHNDVFEILTKRIDYGPVNPKLEDLVFRSKKYLCDNLGCTVD